MRKQSSDQPFIASSARQNVPKSAGISPEVRVFDRLFDTSCSSPTLMLRPAKTQPSKERCDFVD